jgi:hypothetical protein
VLEFSARRTNRITVRLWTIHPRYLDAKGLVAAWREALLAQKVLRGCTRGYRFHPQLIRFRACPRPAAMIASFLHAIAVEAKQRGYRFDRSKILGRRFAGKIPETNGQLQFEWEHLNRKLRSRSPLIARQFRDVKNPHPHPLFRIVAGQVRSWEKQPNTTSEPSELT